MKIKESIGGKITVITVGDASVEPVIRKTLAIGADEAIRVNMVPEDIEGIENLKKLLED